MLLVPEIGANWVNWFVKWHASLKFQFNILKNKNKIYIKDFKFIK